MLYAEKGTESVTPGELELIPAPLATDTWKPVSHARVLDMAVTTLSRMGFAITSMDLITAKGGAQFFGVLDLHSEVSEDITLAVGVRNSTDKTLSAALCAGERVMACSNLAFASEVSISRKHTAYVERDFHERISDAVCQLRQYRDSAAERIKTFKLSHLDEDRANSLILQAYEKGIVGARLVKPLIKEWREPSFFDFRHRNAWSLLNAYTHVIKGRQQEQPIVSALETMDFQEFLQGECHGLAS